MFKEKLVAALELPKEIVLDTPKVYIIGTSDLTVENYKGVIEYDEKILRLNTKSGILVITGEKLNITAITDENVIVNGKIKGVEYVW